MPHEAAVAELIAGAGRQLDPRIVAALLPILEQDTPAPAADRVPARHVSVVTA